MRLAPPLLTAMLVLAIAACTSPDDPTTQPVSSPALTQERLAELMADGPEPLLAPVRTLDYWLHYKLMQVTGIEEALGGEAQAVAALEAIGATYERKLRSITGTDTPRMRPMAFTGEGMLAGYVGLSAAAFAGFMTVGPEVRSAKSIDALIAKPLHKEGVHGSINGDGQLEVSVDMDFDERDLAGKIKIKILSDLCPDPQGKVSVTMDVDSSMHYPKKPGVGGYIRSRFVEEGYYDDDARLLKQDPRDLARADIQMGGSEGGDKRHMDQVITLREGKVTQEVRENSGFSIFRPDEQEIASNMLGSAVGSSMHGIARAMLMVAGDEAGWIESGRCVELKVTSNPAKRKGVRPSTAFDLEAMPRAKSDGAPAGGTVSATLSGGASLQPASGKVPADAKYAYAGPDKKNEEATIRFESRSRRGVGRATLEFDTKRPQAYTAKGGLDDFHGTGTICNLAETFTISGGGNTVTFSPTNEGGGSYSYQGNMGGIGVYGNGTYKATADDKGGAITGSGNGCVKTPMGTRCNNGIERYTLTPIPPCE